MSSIGDQLVERLYAKAKDRDPVHWVETQLDGEVWSKQREIMYSVRDNRRTAVKSAHGVGKSQIAAYIVAEFLDSHPPGEAFAVTTAPTFSQVRFILWRYIGQAHRKGKLRGRVNQTEWHIGEEPVAYGRKPSDYDENAFQGIHAPKVLVVVDEACGIPHQLWVAVDTLLTNEDCHVLAIGNPDNPDSHFATVCQPGSGWSVITISAFDSPNFTGEEVSPKLAHDLVGQVYVTDAERNWGKDSPLYISKVLGEFPTDSEDGIVPASNVALCRAQDVPEEEEDDEVQLGVDVGAGGDQSIIRERRGMSAGRVWRSRHDDPELLTNEIVHAVVETGATRIAIDVIGIGWGIKGSVIKELREHGLAHVEVIGVNVGQASDQPKRFKNCLVSETEVRPLGDLRAVYKARCNGPLFRVKTAMGDDFTGTANHHVLTPLGWVPLQSLSLGSELVHTSAVEGVVLGDPEVNDVPTAIGEVYGSLLHPGNSHRVLSDGVNFHGDRPIGDVDVVVPNGNLSASWPFRRQQTKDSSFVASLHHAALLACCGSAREVTSALDGNNHWLEPSGSVSFGSCGPISFGQLCHSHSARVSHRPDLNASRLECTVGRSRTDLEFTADLLTRFAGDVPIDDQLLHFVAQDLQQSGGHSFSTSAWLDAVRSQQLRDEWMRGPVRTSDRTSGLAGKVTTDHVVDIEIMLHDSSSEVYTLGTSTGAYTTGNIIHKNCRAELWWEVGRELTMQEAWNLAAIDDQTAADLTAPKYFLVSGGRIQVEKKDEVRKRIGRSPDDADALLLAFYRKTRQAKVIRPLDLHRAVHGGRPGRATIGTR